MKSITQANLKNKKVLVRADIDVLLDGEIDTFRLDAGLPTLKYIIGEGGFPIICGHMGKPKEATKELSTTQLIPYFDKNLGTGNYELLENTKFNPKEQEGSEEFAKELASKAEVFVNDSFATCHREYASITGVPKFLESYAGFRLLEEIEELSKVLNNPQRPLVAIIGGAKLESKLPTVSKFIEISDTVLLGGKLGLQWEENLPSNLKIPNDYARDQLDIGQETIKEYKEILSSAKTVVWAGPLGYYEEMEYIRGTEEIAKAIASSGIFSIVGGGDTIAALKKVKLLDKMGFVSTGGGAMLNFLVKGTLPGIEALS